MNIARAMRKSPLNTQDVSAAKLLAQDMMLKGLMETTKILS
jgi:hypothetical protein